MGGFNTGERWICLVRLPRKKVRKSLDFVPEW